MRQVQSARTFNVCLDLGTQFVNLGLVRRVCSFLDRIAGIVVPLMQLHNAVIGIGHGWPPLPRASLAWTGNGTLKTAVIYGQKTKRFKISCSYATAAPCRARQHGGFRMDDGKPDKPVQMVWKYCGSPNVRRDAWANWDVTTQDWVLEDVLDDGYRGECDGETTIAEQPIDAAEEE
jgi:hypothetical protein